MEKNSGSHQIAPDRCRDHRTILDVTKTHRSQFILLKKQLIN